MKHFEDLKVGDRLWWLLSGNTTYDWETVLEIGQGRPARSRLMIDTKSVELNLPKKKGVYSGFPNNALIFASKEELLKTWRKIQKRIASQIKSLEKEPE